MTPIEEIKQLAIIQGYKIFHKNMVEISAGEKDRNKFYDNSDGGHYSSGILEGMNRFILMIEAEIIVKEITLKRVRENLPLKFKGLKSPLKQAGA